MFHSALILLQKKHLLRSLQPCYKLSWHRFELLEACNPFVTLGK